MAKMRALEAEIERTIGKNRTNCDYLLHTLLGCGFSEEDVRPLRKFVEAAQLGKGYYRFLQFAEDLVACEPKIDMRTVVPIMLETWHAVYDMEALHVQRAKKNRKIQHEKDDKAPAYTRAVEAEKEALTVFGKVSVEFNRYRALSHVHLGTYLPKPAELAFEDEGFEVIKACQDSNLERVKQLLSHKKYSPNEYETHTGASPLHYSTWNKDEAIVTNLLEAKANVNAQTLRGFTPLHFAYQQHCKEIVKELLAAKADPCAKSSMGQAPGAKGAGLGSELEITKPFY